MPRMDRLQNHTGGVSMIPAPPPVTSPGSRFAMQYAVASLVGLLLAAMALAVLALPAKFVLAAVMAVLVLILMMITGHVRRILLAVLILDIPFPFGAFSLDWQFNYGGLGAFAGVYISLSAVALIILYGLWLLELLGRKDADLRPKIGPSLPLAFYVGIAALSILVARDRTLSLFELLLLGQMLLLYIYVVSNVRTRDDVLFIVDVLLLGLVLESLLMIAMNAVHHAIAIPGIVTTVEADVVGNRIAGTFSGSPNVAAEYLELLLAPALSLLFMPTPALRRWLAGLALGCGGIALVLTYSRGGWIAFAVSLAIVCLLAWRRGLLSLRVIVAIVVLVALLFGILGGSIMLRLEASDNGATTGRLILLQLAWRIVTDHPVLGVGLNNFAAVLPHYLTPTFDHIFVYVVHNKYLLVWAESGLGGLLAFLAFLGSTLRRGWRCWRATDALLSPLALGFTAAVAGDMAHMFLDVYNSRSSLQQLCLISALIWVMGSLASGRRDGVRPECSDDACLHRDASWRQGGPGDSVAAARAIDVASENLTGT